MPGLSCGVYIIVLDSSCAFSVLPGEGSIAVGGPQNVPISHSRQILDGVPLVSAGRTCRQQYCRRTADLLGTCLSIRGLYAVFSNCISMLVHTSASSWAACRQRRRSRTRESRCTGVLWAPWSSEQHPRVLLLCSLALPTLALAAVRTCVQQYSSYLPGPVV